jgi:hypothetical protein
MERSNFIISQIINVPNCIKLLQKVNINTSTIISFTFYILQPKRSKEYL